MGYGMVFNMVALALREWRSPTPSGNPRPWWRRFGVCLPGRNLKELEQSHDVSRLDVCLLLSCHWVFGGEGERVEGDSCSPQRLKRLDTCLIEG